MLKRTNRIQVNFTTDSIVFQMIYPITTSTVGMEENDENFEILKNGGRAMT